MPSSQATDITIKTERMKANAAEKNKISLHTKASCYAIAYNFRFNDDIYCNTAHRYPQSSIGAIQNQLNLEKIPCIGNFYFLCGF